MTYSIDPKSPVYRLAPIRGRLVDIRDVVTATNLRVTFGCASAQQRHDNRRVFDAAVAEAYAFAISAWVLTHAAIGQQHTSNSTRRGNHSMNYARSRFALQVLAVLCFGWMAVSEVWARVALGRALTPDSTPPFFSGL